MIRTTSASLFCSSRCRSLTIFFRTYKLLHARGTYARFASLSLPLLGRVLSVSAAKTVTTTDDPGSKGPRSSPRLRMRPLPESISDSPPPKVVITSSSPRKTRDPKKRRSSKPSKPKVTTDSKRSTEESRPRRSSESSSTSSTESKGNTERPKRRDRQPTAGGASETIEMVRVRPSVEQRQALAPLAVEETASPTRSPSASTAGVKMWNRKNPAGATAAASVVAAAGTAPAQREAPVEPSMRRGRGHEVKRGTATALAAPLSKPIVLTGRRGRSQQPFKWVIRRSVSFHIPREKALLEVHVAPSGSSICMNDADGVYWAAVICSTADESRHFNRNVLRLAGAL